MDAKARQAIMQGLMEDSMRLLDGIRAGVSLDELEDHLRQRESDLRAFFAEPVPEDMRAEIRRWIESVQTVDQEAMLEVHRLKESALHELSDMRCGLRGARAYQDTLGDSFD